MAVVEAALTVAWWSLATGAGEEEEEEEGGDAEVWAMLGRCSWFGSSAGCVCCRGKKWERVRDK